ncbi:MAG: hypothetical protein EPN43_06325 [Jatrophihabitans sp.]|nr:MAG: hypothetical protein EPN43_06325 [Jatrophihabitans sp.]
MWSTDVIIEEPPLPVRLLAYMRTHVETEGAMLRRYVEVARTTESQAFAYLVDLLIEDEMSHHRVFTELANTLEAEVHDIDREPAVPAMDFDRADRDAVLAGAKELLANEESDLDELKGLQHELRALKKTTLWSLLVEQMQRDTEKHIAILKFVCKHV